MQMGCKVKNKKNIQHFEQKFTARLTNIELKISCLILLWPGRKWSRALDYSYFLLSSCGTLGRCSRNPWVLWNPGWKSLFYSLQCYSVTHLILVWVCN